MKTGALLNPIQPEKLKPLLHQKIDKLNNEELAFLDQVLLRLEIEQSADRLGRAFDEDQAQGKMQRIGELVRQFRDEHPYK